MGNLSVRLPEEVERNLERETQTSGKSRSDLVREAIGEYLTRKERERFMAKMVAAAKALYSDPEARKEGLEIAEEGLEEWLEDIEREERAAGIDPDEKWWD